MFPSATFVVRWRPEGSPSSPTSSTHHRTSPGPLHRADRTLLQPSSTGAPPSTPSSSCAPGPHRAFRALPGELPLESSLPSSRIRVRSRRSRRGQSSSPSAMSSQSSQLLSLAPVLGLELLELPRRQRARPLTPWPPSTLVLPCIPAHSLAAHLQPPVRQPVRRLRLLLCALVSVAAVAPIAPAAVV